MINQTMLLELFETVGSLRIQKNCRTKNFEAEVWYQVGKGKYFVVFKDPNLQKLFSRITEEIAKVKLDPKDTQGGRIYND